MGLHEHERAGEGVWLSGPADPPEEPAEPVESYDPQKHRPPRRARLEWDDMDPVPRRIRASEVTFGLRGRVVVTGVVLLFCAWLSFTNLFFLVPALPAVVWALRDTWRPAPASRGPAPTQARDLGGRLIARGPHDDLVADRLQPIVPVASTAAEPNAATAEPTAATAAEPAVEPAVEAPAPVAPVAGAQRGAGGEDAEWLERLMLDPGLASRVRDKPRAVPPPFPGEAGRAAAQADGSASASPA